MKMMKKLDKWHKTKSGLLIFVLAELAIAYGLASLAIDRGNLWWYLLTIVFFIGAVKNFFKLIGALVRGNRRTT
jgi:hypothetical protein